MILLEALFNVCKIHEYKNFEEIYNASNYLMNNNNKYNLLEYIINKGIDIKIKRQIIQLFYFFDYKIEEERADEEGINKIIRMKELDSKMCFWAVNVYLLNLYASMGGENNKVEKVRNMFYKQTKIDVKRLLRGLLQKFCFF
ncbi:unnamed protein product [Meloidogyne enterolobii]|uniref:Uncharacterized protein n=3 Tax=Meloidogyne enterolobii TaxID=390850 RepID=A0ACB0ZJ37_MELEN|nr:unnamed protein product [Meloidogyne enterolobii]